MFLKYSLIGLGSAGVVGVGGYVVYHEVSKNNLNKDAEQAYGKGSTASPDGRVDTPPAVDSSIQSQLKTTNSPK